jgi:hypothetical protein
MRVERPARPTAPLLATRLGGRGRVELRRDGVLDRVSQLASLHRRRRRFSAAATIWLPASGRRLVLLRKLVLLPWANVHDRRRAQLPTGLAQQANQQRCGHWTFLQNK